MTVPSPIHDSNHPDNTEVQSTLDQAKTLGDRLVDKGRELAAAGQYIIDCVGITEEAIPLVGARQGLHDVNNSWKAANIYLSGTMSRLDQIDLAAIASTSAGSALTSVLNIPIVTATATATCSDIRDTERIATRIKEQITRSGEKETVQALTFHQRNGK